MKINHVGYLVRKLNRAKIAFEELGYVAVSEVIYDDIRDINLCLLEKEGYVIELVEPASKESEMNSLLKKIGNSAYHICYEVDNIESKIEELRLQKYVTCSELCTTRLFNGRRVCFMVHPYMGMIELLEN